jgi:AcrR family transcriptional regulator
VAAPSRQRNPRGEGERLRQQLLDATVEVLGEVGDADKVSVRAIARRAGVSPTALYLQFPDRDALVDAAVDQGFTAFNAVLGAAAGGPGSPRERLEAMGVAYLTFAAHHQALYEVLFTARRPILERPEVPRQRGFEGLVALLRLVDETLDPDDARQLALLIWSSLHGYAMLRVARPHFEWPDAEAYIRRLLAAHHLSA